jgi:hypothetical protein
VTHARLDPLLIQRARSESPAVFQAIRAVFFDQQYSRAAIGEYDRHLVAAYFGLAERRQIEATVTVAHLSDAELAELIEVVDVTPAARIASENGSQSLDHEEEVPQRASRQDRPE